MKALRQLDTLALRELWETIATNPMVALKLLDLELNVGVCPVCRKPRTIPCQKSIIGTDLYCQKEK